MTSTARPQSARIYQFPVKGRVPAPLQAPARPADARPMVVSDFGSGWYHEAAMQDADRSRKH